MNGAARVDSIEPTTALVDLAGRLGIEREELQAVLPMPVWSVEICVDECDADSVEELPEGFASWFVAGEQSLVLIGVGPGGVVLAEPHYVWRSTMVPSLTITGVIEVDGRMGQSLLGWLRESADRIAKVRRGRFRRCSDCGGDTPPERMMGGVNPWCHACAERNHGVVF